MREVFETGPESALPKPVSLFVWLVLLGATGCFVYALCVSWHWPLVHDASIMHYVVFLMDHGMAPYREINDINMPGAFIVEWLAVHVLGPGDLAWRIFDMLTMLAAIGACCVIARSSDWRAGLLAGLLLAAAHMADGAIELGQRDWTLLVFVLAGYAFLYLALERSRPAWMGLFAFACGAAAMVKPLALPVPFVLLAVALAVLRRSGRKLWPFVAWALAGAALATAIFVAFLAGYRATASFFEMLRGLLPFYAKIGSVPYSLMATLLGRVLLTWLLIALGLSVAMGTWRRWQHFLVLLGIPFGALLYFGQHKGFNQHRLTLLAFVLLSVCLQAFLAVKRGGALRWAGIAAFALLLSYSCLHWTLNTRANTYDEGMLLGLEHDLKQQGGSALSGNVQCIEMATGCITDLYRMRLVQSTGFISDIFLLSKQPVPALDALKDRMLSQLTARPPRVIIIVASGFAGGPLHYEPLEDWPAFAQWLRQHYSLKSERRAADGSIERGSYRVYRLQ